MVSKVCAAWLVVLVVLPFTAPFSTFDLGDLMPGHHDHSGGAPSSTLPAAAAHRAALSHAVPLPPRAGRSKFALTRLRVPSVVTIAHPAESVHSGAWMGPVVRSATRPIVLRI